MTATRVIFTLLAMLLGSIYLALVWTAGVEGFRTNPGLVVWSGAVLVVMFVLGMLVGSRNSGRAGARTEERQDVQHVTMIVIPQPTKTSMPSRDQKLLLGAAAAGAVGGLLALFVLKKRGDS